MRDDNKIVHGLWIGSRLSKIELLTIRSFIRHGHHFHLWLYDELENDLPVGVLVRDANEIIPKEKIFRRKHIDPVCNVGKGSVGSPFADLFRYKLLYAHGGWWADMDVACLKPLDFSEDYVFREHDKVIVIGNVIKVPRHSELMKITIEKVEASCDENTVDWLLPNRILSEVILQLNLACYIRKNISNRDIWPEIQKFIFKKRKVPETWYVLHWLNEEWRMRDISKDEIPSVSTLGRLLHQYDLGEKPGYADKLIGKLINPFSG